MQVQLRAEIARLEESLAQKVKRETDTLRVELLTFKYAAILATIVVTLGVMMTIFH
jgi:hypothetical protein